ncbi:MAG: thioredoxin family protein [Planctomycetota bacterium]
MILVVGAVIAVKENNKANSEPKAAENPVENISAVKTPILGTEKAKEFETLPRLVDLGADKCIPCKMMAPVLEELKKDYAGTLSVEFIDVWKNPDKAKEYEIMIIPTQIFFDASGKELFRHEGFFSKEDILAKWKQLGVNIERRRE